jgi:uncharacterized membrane protein YdbT with pleckstrin-like domain
MLGLVRVDVNMSKNIRNSHPGERTLFKTRPRFLSTLESAVLRCIILFLLVYFFTTLISYAAMIQGRFTSLTNVPFVEYSTYVLVLVIVLLFLSLIWTVISWRSISYILTNHRVMIKSGVISKKNVYMHYGKIQDIIVTQSLFQRISYSGNIEIFGGHDRTSLILVNIPEPEKVENMINQRIEGTDKETENPENFGGNLNG